MEMLARSLTGWGAPWEKTLQARALRTYVLRFLSFARIINVQDSLTLLLDPWEKTQQVCDKCAFHPIYSSPLPTSRPQ